MTGRTRYPCHGDQWRRGKRRFKSKEAAEWALSTVWAGGHAYPGALPCRIYFCQCGHWHHSTRPASELDLGEVRSELPTQPTGMSNDARIA